LQGYATHNAQIDYPKGYHLVSDASAYELLLHPGYHNLTIIIRSTINDFRPRGNKLKSKVNSLWLRDNKFKHKALRLRLKGSRDNKLLA
jgi:hypothetical protein